MFMLFVFFSFSKRKKILQNDIILSEVEKYENGVIPSKQCEPVMLVTSHFRKSNKVFILSIDPTTYMEQPNFLLTNPNIIIVC
jgi:hypothetical protein